MDLAPHSAPLLYMIALGRVARLAARGHPPPARVLQKEEDEVKTDQGSRLCFGPRPLQKEEGELKTNVAAQHIKTMKGEALML